MSTNHRNFLTFFYALTFVIRVKLSLLVRWVYRQVFHFLSEIFFLFRHSKPLGSIKLLCRISRVVGARRWRINSVKWRYCPRIGDTCAALMIVLIFGHLAWRDYAERKSFSLTSFVTRSFNVAASSADGRESFTRLRTDSPQRQTKRLHVVLNAQQTLSQLWSSLGLHIEDEQVWSAAFAEFYDRRHQELNRHLSMRIDLKPAEANANISTESSRQDQDRIWRLQRLVMNIAEGYQVILTPQVSLFGEPGFTSKLKDTGVRQPYVLVQDRVSRLFASAEEYTLEADEGQLGSLGLPVYLGNLLVFLDRVLESQGGLYHQGFVSAVFRVNGRAAPRLEYVRLQQPNKMLEMVRLSLDSRDEGHMYEIDGHAVIPSNWGDPLAHVARESSGFGIRLHPIKKFNAFHRGVDYAAPTGTPVFATKDGLVQSLRNDPDGYGKWVGIKHAGEFSTIYAHLQGFHPDLKLGYPVEKSQVIGFVGNTGLSTGPHLHYEVLHQGRPVNPKLVQIPESRLLSPHLSKKVARLMEEYRAKIPKL